MGYKILIKGEEDKILSKVIKEFEQAEQLAQNLFDNFVESDFGDEIFIIDEKAKNKGFKPLWKNGKNLIPKPLEIGDLVKVVNKGQTYSTYEAFMETYGTKTLKENWVCGHSAYTTHTYKVKVLDKHPEWEENTLAIIQSEIDNSVFIIGVKGLEKIIENN